MTATGPAASDDTMDAPVEKAMQAERAHAAQVRELASASASGTPAQEGASPVEKRRSGFGPLLAGGVLAAVIGAGAAIWALPYLPAQFTSLLMQQDNSVATTLDEQARKLTTLEAQVQALASRPTPQSGPAPDISALKGALDQTMAQVQEIGARLKAVEERPVPAATGMTADVQAQIEALKLQVAGLSTEGISARVDAAAEQAETRLKQNETQLMDMRAQAEQATQQAIRQSLVARLATAFDAGMPLAPVIAQAQAAGLTVPGEISATVPTLATLQMDFPQAARLALAASRREEAAQGGIWQRLEALVKTQVGARSVTPQQGDSADAILSRATAAVEAGDMARAVTELQSLPQAGQDAISGWVALAQARLAAGDALAKLATTQQ